MRVRRWEGMVGAVVVVVVVVVRDGEAGWVLRMDGWICCGRADGGVSNAALGGEFRFDGAVYARWCVKTGVGKVGVRRAIAGR